MSDKRTALELCLPQGTPHSLYLAGEAVGYLRALTELSAFLPASWMNEHKHDKAGAARWMLMKIADIKAGRAT